MSRAEEDAAILRADAHLKGLFDFVRGQTDKRVLLAGTVVEMPSERVFADQAEVDSYVERVLSVTEIHQHWPRAYNMPTVVPADMRETTVLHALAHALTQSEPEDHLYMFRKCYVDLLRAAIAPEVGVAFHVCLHKEGLVA